MALIDGFGAAVSHHKQRDVDDFYSAAQDLLGYRPDPINKINQVLQRSPEFIMGHCFRAGMHLIASDHNQQQKLANKFQILQQLSPAANDRELGHIKAIGLWLNGNWYGASQVYADILYYYPRDLTALQFGHQIDFLLGQASSNRDRSARVLKHWSSTDSDSSFLYGMLAFGLEESGHYPQAEAMAEQCLSLNPQDTWGTHALAHCYEMQGKTQQGVDFMQHTEANWASGNYLAIHNRWHSTLFLLEQCEFGQALAVYDQHLKVHVNSELMDMHDAVALLWRLTLMGCDVGDRWHSVADNYCKFIDQAYMPFNDMHAMMSFVMTGRSSEAELLIAVLELQAESDSTRSMIIRLAGLPILKAIMAFADGDFSRAKKLLTSTRHLTHLIGGSIAQRDILSLTLLEAARRSADRQMLEGLLAERCLLKPESALTEWFRRV
ncbi:MAG: tetratricopeptide repeat protein [Pseudomonadales bacterium]|nr:tetratricopeptide repeat protein [Pseudomonadales bacterium]NRA14668.1 tetratricopeptide repeat protein [Oceanospirillaceae bacterium]